MSRDGWTPAEVTARLEKAFPGCLVQNLTLEIEWDNAKAFSVRLLLPHDALDTVDGEARVVEDAPALPAPQRLLPGPPS